MLSPQSSTELENENEGQCASNSSLHLDLDGQSQQNYNKIHRVERVLGKRILDGRVQYKLRWIAAGEEEDTWEYAEDCYCRELIRRYEEEHKDIQPEVVSSRMMETAEEQATTITMEEDEENGTGNGPGEQNGKEAANSAAGNGPEHGQQIPLAEKDAYHFGVNGATVIDILGMAPLPHNTTTTSAKKKAKGGGGKPKTMILLRYSDDFCEFVPIDVLRKCGGEEGEKLLFDYYASRMQIVSDSEPETDDE